MVGWHAIVGIVIVALGLVVTPGPNMIYLVSRSITRAGAPACCRCRAWRSGSSCTSCSPRWAWRRY